ncbi:flagellar hook-associated protein 1 FlgK [Paraburkholderia bryophila]|uniref:Flagellar hook-associated protein 1 n=1 Tax=Paraburkholderia bryophila TaxID=420952 RepID=A0A7Y9WB74_9BURK|nr:flagellar hook-associated protein 1 FlgK [Paraburkholderia bryophila]
MSDLINLGLSGLNAAQWGLTTTGQNISNASTPGYTIETPVYAESGGQYTGSGYLPQGVSTVTVTRQYSQYLTTQLNNAQASGSSLSTYNTLISQLNNLIGSPTAGISSAITSYFTGLQNVSNSPSTLSTRQTAVSGAQTLVNQINAAGQQYDSLRQSVNTQLTNTVSQINSYTQQIAQLNGQIAQASTQGQPPNQLMDQRDLAVSNLSQLVGVQVVNSNGSYSVFMGNGQPLVSSTNSYNLGTAPSTGDSSELSVQYLGQAGANPAATPQNLPDSKVTGGSLGGLLQFRSQTLDPGEAQLGAIAVSFSAQVNAQNSLGITLGGTQGGALFSVGSPTVYANTQNTGNASLNVSFANPAQPTTGDYTLAFNGTTYTLTDNSSGAVVGSATNLTQPINGLNFSTTGTMKPGDSFTVEPTRGALNSFATASTDPAAIAAALPLQVAASTANTGTATITSPSVTAGYTMPNATTTLSYTGAGPDRFPGGIDGDDRRQPADKLSDQRRRNHRGAVFDRQRRDADDHQCVRRPDEQRHDDHQRHAGRGRQVHHRPEHRRDQRRPQRAGAVESVHREGVGGRHGHAERRIRELRQPDRQPDESGADGEHGANRAGDADHRRAAVGLRREH